MRIYLLSFCLLSHLPAAAGGDPFAVSMDGALSAYKDKKYKTTVVQMRHLLSLSEEGYPRARDARERVTVAMGLVYTELGRPQYAGMHVEEASGRPEAAIGWDDPDKARVVGEALDERAREQATAWRDAERPCVD